MSGSVRSNKLAPIDVLVIGAGPAGSTIARLLAEWGRSVLLLKGPSQRSFLAESLPPSIKNVFAVTGILEDVEKAGFYPDRGNTSWWTAPEPRIENYSGELQGYHVDRRRFDKLLLSLAERAGVPLSKNTRAPRLDLQAGTVEHDGGLSTARFIVDASGRSGLVARQIKRYWDERYRTIGMCAVVEAASPWDVDPHHTVIEAFDRGWAWSVPLAPDRRYVSFMVDASTVRGGMEQTYRAAMARTIQFMRLFASSTPQDAPWGRDASLYYAERYAGSNWMLVGDAGSFVDPLSSFGVKKAMLSAWNGAVVVNTCLEKPDLAAAAIEMYNAREAETWMDHARQAAQHFAEAASEFKTPFWQSRAILPGTVLYRPEELKQAYEHLRQASAVRFSLASEVHCEQKPVIRGREVVLQERTVLPGLANTEYMQGVHLATAASMAPSFCCVGELYEAYVRELGETPLPNFLAALSLLLTKGALRLEATG